jgi:bifunctional DNA-binding transcriptional regulator/antitoxin component of YhaV-PrlF toxin-antitoxin module
MGRISSRGQVAISKSIMNEMNLQPGDILEFKVQKGLLVGKPKKLIDADQTWFWTKEWQEGEHEAEEDIKTGRIKEYKSVREFLNRRNKK